MLGSNEPSFADVDELLTSWINASAPESSSNATISKACERATAQNQAPPRVSGLLQGTYTRDINPSLQNTRISEGRYIDHARSAAAVAKAGDQATTAGSKTLDPEGDLNAKRGKHSAQAASEPATRNSEVNRRAQKKFRQRQKVSSANHPQLLATHGTHSTLHCSQFNTSYTHTHIIFATDAYVDIADCDGLHDRSAFRGCKPN